MSSSASTSKSYIVMFKDNTPPATVEKIISDIQEAGGSIGHCYDSVFLGFSATFPLGTYETLEKHPDIESIEVDGQVKIQPIEQS